MFHWFVFVAMSLAQEIQDTPAFIEVQMKVDAFRDEKVILANFSETAYVALARLSVYQRSKFNGNDMLRIKIQENGEAVPAGDVAVRLRRHSNDIAMRALGVISIAILSSQFDPETKSAPTDADALDKPFVMAVVFGCFVGCVCCVCFVKEYISQNERSDEESEERHRQMRTLEVKIHEESVEHPHEDVAKVQKQWCDEMTSLHTSLQKVQDKNLELSVKVTQRFHRDEIQRSLQPEVVKERIWLPTAEDQDESPWKYKDPQGPMAEASVGCREEKDESPFVKPMITQTVFEAPPYTEALVPMLIPKKVIVAELHSVRNSQLKILESLQQLRKKAMEI